MNLKSSSLFALSAILSLLLSLQPIQTAAAQESLDIKEIIKKDENISASAIRKLNGAIIVSDTLRGWDLNWRGGLNGSQAAYSNWSQGGVNTVSFTASTVFNLRYRKDKFAYALSTNLKYGKATLEGSETRKTDDRIAVNNKFSYLFDDESWSAFGNVNFSTQFDKGFNYSVPEGQDPILISRFFAPAYFTQIAGIAYNPAEYFTAEAGLALKETIVSDTALSTRYGLNPGEQFRFEPGYSLAMNFEKTVMNNIKLISTLESFTNLQRNIKSTDVTFTNEIIGKINNFMNTSFQFVMIYDDDFSKQAQIKQVLSVGLSFSII